MSHMTSLVILHVPALPLPAGTAVAIYPTMLGFMIAGLVLSSAVKVYLSHKHLNGGMNRVTAPSADFRAWKASR